MTDIPINPAVLVWARNERGLTPSEAAKRLGVSENEFTELERATKLPITRLRQIASKYAITFASLLMPEPLPASTRIQIKDFRTVGGRGPLADHNLMIQMDDLNTQMDILAEIKEADPEIFTSPLFDRVTLKSDEEELAYQERAKCGISVDEQISWDKDTLAFRRWRSVLEKRGVFVYSLKLGSPKICRGLSILDNRNIAVAVINSEEASYRPRCFTLWHEYAHILLRETGISDENRKNEVERFCNQFSAFFLMPRGEFLRIGRIIGPKKGQWSEYHVARLSTLFRVSKTVASIHMEQVGFVPNNYYRDLRAQWAMYRPKKGGGIATPAEKNLNKYGVRHVELVLNALDRGKINKLDARELLDVGPKYFDALRHEAKARQETYGGVG